MPALLTSTSSRPWASSTARMIRSGPPSAVMSAAKGTIRSYPAAVSSRSPARRPIATTRAPSAAKAQAVDRPMPVPAPLTATTLLLCGAVLFMPVILQPCRQRQGQAAMISGYQAGSVRGVVIRDRAGSTSRALCLGRGTLGVSRCSAPSFAGDASPERRDDQSTRPSAVAWCTGCMSCAVSAGASPARPRLYSPTTPGRTRRPCARASPRRRSRCPRAGPGSPAGRARAGSEGRLGRRRRRHQRSVGSTRSRPLSRRI